VATKRCIYTKSRNILNGYHSLVSVYTPNICKNYGTMVNLLVAEVCYDLQWSGSMIIIELR
jgi:hypothetical protein